MNTNIAYRRLANQLINSPISLEPEEVVRRLGALQAQDYLQAVWAVGLRTPSATLAAVERAIAEGKIVLTWTLRGTIHCVPPEDVKWLLRLSGPRLLKQAVRRMAQLELDEGTLERSRKIIYNALKSGGSIRRPDLLALLEGEGIRTEGQRGYHILWHSAYSGLICFGPRNGKQQTFVLLDKWVEHSRQLSFEESLSELALRYFTAHGPATVKDLAWWAGITLTEARAGLEAVKPKLISEIITGAEYWMPATPAETQLPSKEVQLLPGFDEYILGYNDRSAVLEPETAPRIVPSNNGVFLPAIAADGQILGTWKRTVKTKGIELKFSPFEPLEHKWREKLMQAAERYAAFLGLPVLKTECEEAHTAR
ncbi:winged helix DNA-binding domain-containing protein [Paenibacillus graminis]|uniref:Prevent-host-death protein n=1 Tax=Paenibacillus graminis TaxID=189425 RepID=A0A089MDV0_9BACL|nr:winged helix DNA-binding domain-containing protein [Paenibacillus graminis]AIQ69663.1 prevent-host-death protein [Paenibacillus graminis]